MMFEDLLTNYSKPKYSGHKRKRETEDACYPIKAKVAIWELNQYRDKDSPKITLRTKGTTWQECYLCGSYENLKSEYKKTNRNLHAI